MAEPTPTAALIDEHEVIGANRWLVVLRLLILIVGGYAATSALVAGTARVLPVTGLARSEAVALASMCGFGFYLALLIWGFSCSHLTRLLLGVTLAGGFGLALMLSMQV